MGKILRLPKVKEITGLSRSMIYHNIDKGTFPRPVKLGERAVGWPESEIKAWLKTRPGMPEEQLSGGPCEEIRVIEKILFLLSDLEPDVMKRILRYVNDRFS